MLWMLASAQNIHAMVHKKLLTVAVGGGWGLWQEAAYLKWFELDHVTYTQHTKLASKQTVSKGMAVHS